MPHQKRALQVDPQHGIKIGLADLQKVSCLEDAGVVHQHIDAAEISHAARHHGVHLGLVAHVAVDESGSQLGGQGLALSVVHVHQNGPRAVVHETAHTGFANALRATCDQADATGQTK